MRQPKACRVIDDGDRRVITTSARRSQAILLVLGGATLQEAGTKLGVTRERIRQYLRDAGLVPGDRIRWRTTMEPGNREHPTRGPKAAWAWWHYNRLARQRRHARIRNRWVEGIGYIRWFMDEFGHQPHYSELASLVWGHDMPRHQAAPVLNSWLGSSRGTSNRIHSLYRLAGTTPHPKGTPGHIVELDRSQPEEAS